MKKVLPIIAIIIASTMIMFTGINVNGQNGGPIPTNIDLEITIDGLVVRTVFSATYLNDHYETITYPFRIQIPQRTYITSFRIDGIDAILVEKEIVNKGKEIEGLTDDQIKGIGTGSFNIDLPPGGYHTIQFTMESRLFMKDGNYSYDMALETVMDYPSFNEVSIKISDQMTHMKLNRYIDTSKGNFPLTRSLSMVNGFQFFEDRTEPRAGDNIGFSIGPGDEDWYTAFYHEDGGEGHFVVSCSPNRNGQTQTNSLLDKYGSDLYLQHLVEEGLETIGPGEEVILTGEYEPSEAGFHMDLDVIGPEGEISKRIGGVDDNTYVQSWVKRYWELAWMDSIMIDALQMGGGNGTREVIVEFSTERSILSPYTEFIFLERAADDGYLPANDLTDEIELSQGEYTDGIDEKRTSIDPWGDLDGYWWGVETDNVSFVGSDPTFLERYWPILAISSTIVIITIIGSVLYSRLREEELLKQENRKRIYERITEKPGIHFRGIQKDLGLEVGTLSHHMNILEREQLIVSEQDRNNRRFWVAGVNRDLEQVRLSRIQENILKEIQDEPGITQVQISKRLGVSRKVVFYHVKFLTSSEMVSEEKVKRRAHYYPTD